MNISRQHARIAYSKESGAHCFVQLSSAFCLPNSCALLHAKNYQPPGCQGADVVSLYRAVGAACAGKEWGHPAWHPADTRESPASLEVPGYDPDRREAIPLSPSQGSPVVSGRLHNLLMLNSLLLAPHSVRSYIYPPRLASCMNSHSPAILS